MDSKIEKKIISEYKKGKGSVAISKIVGYSKRTILNILNKHNLIRKKDRCKSLDIKKDGEKYYIIRKCPKCNNEIKTLSKNKTIACRNHFNKINNGNLCKPCSLKLQIGEGNPFYGKKHSESSKDKISKSRSGKYIGENNHMKKDEFRKMSKKIMTSNWEKNILTKEKMSEKIKQTRRDGKIKSVITSKKEKEIISQINKLGFKTKQSHRVDTKICDIYIESLNLIIEFFGDYWHCNPKKYDKDYYNKKKSLTANQIWEYDRNKIDLIKSYGYNLEVIWESDFKNNDKLINHIIKKYVKSKQFDANHR